MKKLSKLKLNVLREQDLVEKQMNALRGGGGCGCSCYWAGNGGSSTNSNRNANSVYGYESQHGCSQYGVDQNDEYSECLGCDESNPGYFDY